jgi:hypothetical protein
MPKIKRSLLKHFLNVGTVGAPTWSLISTGVKAGKISYKPKITDEQYIIDSTASISVDSYAPTLPIEVEAIKGDPIFVYLDAKRRLRSTLAAMETELLNVYLYKGAAGTKYLAEKQAVSVPIDKFGGPAGQAAMLSYTLNYKGSAVMGLFDASDSTFDESVDSAYLTSLVIGDTPLILSPSFKGKRIWYKTATENATDSITVTGPDGATFDIDVDGVTVANEADATWSEGLNVVTITCTVDGNVATYIVLVTYTPAE